MNKLILLGMVAIFVAGGIRRRDGSLGAIRCWLGQAQGKCQDPSWLMTFSELEHKNSHGKPGYMKREGSSRTMGSTSLAMALTVIVLFGTAFLWYSCRGQPSAPTIQLTLLRGRAERGDAQAQLDLATIFSLGTPGVDADSVEAAKWFRKAAEQNLPVAQLDLGICYESGRGVQKDEVEAVKWYSKAANQDYAQAQYNLGVCYDQGKGVEKDDVKMIFWYRRAALQNHTSALYNLGVCHQNGRGVERNEVEAAKCYRKAAEQNCANAQYNLACSYVDGKGVTRDEVQALDWYRKAAEGGHATAQYNLGVSFKVGKGVQVDEVEAYKWMLLAGAQGDVDAKQASRDLEAELRPSERAEGQKRASEFKPREGVILVIEDSMQDKNPPPDLLDKANAGNVQAQNELGEAFYIGKLGLKRNALEAVKWFRLAAVQNYPRAQANLGDCYESGNGVAEYDVEAFKWNWLAAGQGDPAGKLNVTKLELMLSQQEIAEGKRLAQEWLEGQKSHNGNHLSDQKKQ